MAAPSHPIRLPEKPALEGLEAKWNARWEEEGTYRFDSTASRDERLLDRHAAADGERVAARRPRLLLHPHRRRRALPAHARQGRLLPDGVGRQRPAHRAPGPELLRRALRSVAAVRPGLHAAREAGQAGDLGVAAELHRAVHPAHARRREGLRAPVAPPRPVGGLVPHLRHHRQAGAAGVAGRVPPAAGPRRRRISSRRRRCGTWTFAPPWRRPSSRIASSPAPTTACGFPAPTAAFVDIETTRPELLPACVALVAHPDDARYQPLFETSVRTPLFGVPIPVKAHALADPEKGSGIAMICTFGDLTDVDLVARAVAAGARRDPAKRHAAAGDVRIRGVALGRRQHGPGRSTTSWRGCRCPRRAPRSWSCCRPAAS